MDEVVTKKDVPVKKETVKLTKHLARLTDEKPRIVYIVIATVVPSLVVSIIYLAITLHRLSVRLTDMSEYVGTIEARTVSLENKQTEFHGRLTQLDGKFTAFSSSPVLKEVETLAPRVTLLEKQLSSMHVRQKITPFRSSTVQAANKKYYEIKEGDNLFQISQRYGLSVDELARMNGLHEEELIFVGQKLVVSK
jgi:LysM repeat protein